MVVYIENPIDSTKMLLDLVSEFSKTVKYKVSTQKSKAFLYTSNEMSETETRKNLNCYSNNKNYVPTNKVNRGAK